MKEYCKNNFYLWTSIISGCIWQYFSFVKLCTDDRLCNFERNLVDHVLLKCRKLVVYYWNWNSSFPHHHQTQVASHSATKPFISTPIPLSTAMSPYYKFRNFTTNFYLLLLPLLHLTSTESIYLHYLSNSTSNVTYFYYHPNHLLTHQILCFHHHWIYYCLLYYMSICSCNAWSNKSFMILISTTIAIFICWLFVTLVTS